MAKTPYKNEQNRAIEKKFDIKPERIIKVKMSKLR